MARNSLLCADMPLRNYSLPPPREGSPVDGRGSVVGSFYFYLALVLMSKNMMLMVMLSY